MLDSHSFRQGLHVHYSSSHLFMFLHQTLWCRSLKHRGSPRMPGSAVHGFSAARPDLTSYNLTRGLRQGAKVLLYQRRIRFVIVWKVGRPTLRLPREDGIGEHWGGWWPTLSFNRGSRRHGRRRGKLEWFERSARQVHIKANERLLWKGYYWVKYEGPQGWEQIGRGQVVHKTMHAELKRAKLEL